MRHIISLLMENEAGALSRVAGLFSARGYNIESLSVAPTEDPSLSRMTIVTIGPDQVIEQITKQLNKLVDIVKLVDLTQGKHIERELMLVKLQISETATHDALQRLAEEYDGRVLDESENIYTVELIGEGEKLDAFIKAVGEDAIVETVRTGASGMSCGARSLQV